MSSYYFNGLYRFNGSLCRGIRYDLLTVNNNARDPGIPFLPLEDPIPVGDVRLANIVVRVANLFSVGQPVKISPIAMIEKVAFRSSLVSNHTSSLAVLTRAGVSSQVLFSKIRFSTLLQATFPRLQNSSLKLGEFVIGAGVITLSLKNSLSMIKLAILNSTMKSDVRTLGSDVKQSTSAQATRLNLREANSVVKISLVGVVSKLAARDQSSIVKIAPSQLRTLLKHRGVLDITRISNGVILTVLKNQMSNEAGKLALVIVGSVDQALQIKQAVASGRISSTNIVSQVAFSTVNAFERMVLGDILTTLGIRFDVVSGQAVAVVLDPCTGNVPAGLALVNRLENDFIDFTLCGGQDRFVFEESAAYLELRKRGLL